MGEHTVSRRGHIRVLRPCCRCRSTADRLSVDWSDRGDVSFRGRMVWRCSRAGNGDRRSLLTIRRLESKRVHRKGTRKDLYILLLIGVVTVIGFTNTAWYTATGGDFDYRDTIGPWFRGILTFRPMPEMVATAPWGVQAHIR